MTTALGCRVVDVDRLPLGHSRDGAAAAIGQRLHQSADARQPRVGCHERALFPGGVAKDEHAPTATLVDVAEARASKCRHLRQHLILVVQLIAASSDELELLERELDDLDNLSCRRELPPLA